MAMYSMSGLVTMAGEGINEIVQRRPVIGMGEKHLHAEQGDDGADERDDQRFNVTESPALQEQNQQHVQAGDEHAVEERNVEEQFERDGRADDFSQVAGGDGDLGARSTGEADFAVRRPHCKAAPDRAPWRRRA